MKKRYIALRIMGTIYKVLGIIIGLATILAVIGTIGISIIGGTTMQGLSQQLGAYTSNVGIFGSALGGLLLSLFTLLYGSFVAVSFLAVGEGIYLLIAIGENTYKSVTLLQAKAADNNIVG